MLIHLLFRQSTRTFNGIFRAWDHAHCITLSPTPTVTSAVSCVRLSRIQNCAHFTGDICVHSIPSINAFYGAQQVFFSSKPGRLDWFTEKMKRSFSSNINREHRNLSPQSVMNKLNSLTDRFNILFDSNVFEMIQKEALEYPQLGTLRLLLRDCFQISAWNHKDLKIPYIRNILKIRPAGGRSWSSHLQRD